MLCDPSSRCEHASRAAVKHANHLKSTIGHCRLAWSRTPAFFASELALVPVLSTLNVKDRIPATKSRTVHLPTTAESTQQRHIAARSTSWERTLAPPSSLCIAARCTSGRRHDGNERPVLHSCKCKGSDEQLWVSRAWFSAKQPLTQR